MHVLLTEKVTLSRSERLWFCPNRRLVGSDLRAWYRLWTDYGVLFHNQIREELPTIHSETALPPQLRRACAALRRYSLGAIPKTRLKALLNAASES
jgi:hypothetical protein